MPREREAYRLNLERICEYFPNTGEMLNVKQVVEFTGNNYRTVKELYSFNSKNFISKAKLAMEMS